MVSQVTFNKDRWLAALMLDPVTGLDPPGIKVRAAEGLDAASTFIQGYWIWYLEFWSMRLEIDHDCRLQVKDYRKPCCSELRHEQHGTCSL